MKKILIVVLLAIAPAVLFAQTGLPRFGAIQNGGFDNLNMYNLNFEFGVPVVSIKARGLDFSPVLAYNSLLFFKNGSAWSPVVDQNGTPAYGWNRQRPTGTPKFSSFRHRCIADNGTNQWSYRYYNFTYTEVDGTVHPFDLDFNLAESPTQFPECSDSSPVQSGYSIDGMGFYVNAPGVGGPNPLNAIHPKAWTPSGSDVDMGGLLKDTNGNFISSTYINSSETDWSDSTGRTSLKVINSTSPLQTKYQYLDNSGTWQSVTMILTSNNVWTAFGCSGITEYSATNVPLPTSVSLPNGTSYSITYEASPGHSGYTTGRIYKVTLPTGGYVQYTYSGGTNCADGSPINLTRTVNDGTTSYSWSYSRTTSTSQTKVTAPTLPYDSTGNDTRYTFDSKGFPTRVESFQGSVGGTLLQQIDTVYSINTELPYTVTTTLGSKVKQTTFGFDLYGNLWNEYDYGWDGTLIRSIFNTYLSDSAHLSANILNLISNTQVWDGSTGGTLRSDTDYIYDESGKITSCPAGQLNHDDIGYSCTNLIRGNVTTIKNYTVGATSPITTTVTYDFFGNPLTTTVDGTLQATATYSTTTHYALPDSVAVGQAGNSLTTSYGYNASTNLPSSVTDPNNGVMSYTFDTMYRSTKIVRPDSQQITIAYDDVSAGRPITTTSPLDSGRTLQQINWSDGLGRTYATQTPVGITQIQFDGVGHVFHTSNPFAIGSSPAYWSETRFDALGRVTKENDPNGVTTNSYSYADNAMTVSDGAGKQKKYAYDALGRTVTVWEDPSVLNYQTSYVYTALNSISTVTQGVQSRSFVYDGLNRLTSMTTPEAGTSAFGYSGCSKDPSNVCSRTDARGVITSYSYDGLNRPYQVIYNVGSTGVPATLNVTYSFGTLAALFNNGRLVSINDASSSDTFTYDLMGDVLSDSKVIDTKTYTTQYAYNPARLLTSLTYPSGNYITESYDATGQLTSLVDNNGKQYASAIAHNPAGQITGYNMVLSGGLVSASYGYAPDRQRLQTLAYSLPSNTLLSLGYGYFNNDQIQQVTDNTQSGRTATYTYDALARLKSLTTVGSSSYPALSMGWTYDQFGNRLTQVNGGTQTVNVSSTTNRLNGPGQTYDANGNQSSDGTYAYQWDAENRMVDYAGGSVTNRYDGNGVRVQRIRSGGANVVYVFSGSQPIAEYADHADAAAPLIEYVYLGGQLIGSNHPGSIDVRFTNDSCSGCGGGTPVGGGDRNLFVNSISIGATAYLPSDPAVSYVSAPCNRNEGGVGWLLCNGDMIASTRASGTTITVNAYGQSDYSIYPHMQLWVNGALLGEWDVTGTAQNYSVTVPTTTSPVYTFFERDHLSVRGILADATPGSPAEQGHLPFGENWYGGTNKWKFTSYERDSDVGDDFAMARRYQYTFGRFSSPDPIMGSPDNPQRWNRYQYVLNAPNVYTDPDGRDIAACYIFWTGDGDLETSFCVGGSTGSAVDEVWGIGLAIYSVERDAAFNSADERANRAREDRLNAMKDVCQLKIQDAVNQQFATGTDAVKLEADPDSGFHHGGAWNFNFTAQDLPQTEFNDIKQKRYNLPNGASLHVPNPQWHLLPFLPNPFDPNATWQRNPNNNSITFTAHIDSANGGAFPFGTIKHFFKDVLGNGSRNPCP